MGNEIGRGDRPVSPSSYRPLIRVRGMHSLIVLPVGPVHTYLVHWDPVDLRTVPCVMTDCSNCSRFVSRRPMSYVAVVKLEWQDNSQRWTKAILEVPFSTGILLTDLKGQIVALKRVRRAGPVIIGSYNGPTKPEDVKPFEILPVLFRLWRISSVEQLRLLPANEWSMWNVASD